MSKAEKTRQKIIELASPIFLSHGYNGTSMSQLTEAIGMTKGAIYGNFKDKDELALAAFRYNFERISKAIGQSVDAQENACDKLLAFAGYYLKEFSEIMKRGGCPLLNAAIDSDHVFPPLKDAVEKALSRWFRYIRRIIKEGIKKGEIKPDTDAEAFASVFISLVEGSNMMSKVTGDMVHIKRNIDHMIRMIDNDLRV